MIHFFNFFSMQYPCIQATVYIVSFLLVLGCQQDVNADYSELLVQEIKTPADSSSLFPSLTRGPDDGLWLNWLYEPDTLSRLMWSRLDAAGNWTVPQEIASGDEWFVNWADFSSLTIGPDGQLLTYTLPKSGEGVYAYDVGLYQSSDAGQSWQGPIIPHRDSVVAEHGFVAFVPSQEKDKIGLVWLDGRNYESAAGHDSHAAGGEPDMTLRYATINTQQQIGDEAELDARVCSCCQTDAAAIPGGAIVVYRDRIEEEIRDISYVRLQNGHWSEPQSIHADGWQIAGCPVNGPAIASADESVAVVWYTAANSTPAVYLSFSANAGETFGNPIQVDEGAPIGRVDIQLLDKSHALISWLEQEGPAQAALRLKVIDSSGATIAETRVSDYDPSRASGFPRMALSKGRAYLSWTQTGEKPLVRMAEIRFAGKS